MSTYGYGFVEYKTVAEAAMAVKEVRVACWDGAV
jgi:hypothetical protein